MNVTDWAHTVRELRTRLRLKQGTLAELLGVSQTYISRLEAGTAKPTQDVADAIHRLTEDPRTRSVFDDFLASVRHSPFPSFMVRSGDDSFHVAAASASAAPYCGGEKQSLSKVAHAAQIIDDLRTLDERGMNQGRVVAGRNSWRAEDGSTSALDVHYSPIRDESGAWYVHATLAPRAEDRAPARGLSIEYFADSAPVG